MESPRTTDCARCGKTLQPSHRFCPECGLPATGGSVLSSQIEELRTASQPESAGRRATSWRRMLVPTASAITVAIVLAVGLMLFNRPLIEMVFPQVRDAEAAPIVVSPSWEPVWVTIPAGEFHVDEPFDISAEEIEAWMENGVPAALQSKRITNARWMAFLLANEDQLTLTDDDGGIRWGDDFIPRFAYGWRRVGPERRPVPPNGQDDNPGPDDLVEDVEFEEVRAYLEWVASTPEYHIQRRSITHRKWESFLVRKEEALRAEGLFAECIPGPGSGWHTNGDDRMPAAPIELVERDAEDLPVTHVGESALASFQVWLSTSPYSYFLWPPSVDDSQRIPNWLWMEFLDENQEGLADAGLWNEAVPAPSSGWTLDPFFGPAMPTVARREVEDGNISGVSIEALRRYHDWSTLKRIKYDFEISRYEVTNALWRDFLEDQDAQLEKQGVLDEAIPGAYGGWVLDQSGRYAPPPDALDLPVRNISLRAVARFAAYLTRRLDQPGYKIRPPTDFEWEYAARGTGWNSYPWGSKFLLESELGTGGPKPPIGIYERRPLRVDSVDPDDRSELGVVGMGTNVREFVEHWERDRFNKEYRTWSELRGASFKDPIWAARAKARVWVARKVDDRTRLPHVGVRLVKVFFKE